MKTGELRALYLTPFLDENLLKEDFTGPGPVLAWYMQDGLGSVRQLVVGKRVTNSHTYTAWGMPLRWRETITNRYTYTGREYNSESSDYYYRARHYTPSFGRFTTRDKFVVTDFYLYALGRPTRFRDPRGLYSDAWDVGGWVEDGEFRWYKSYTLTYHSEPSCRLGARVKVQIIWGEGVHKEHAKQVLEQTAVLFKSMMKDKYKIVPDNPDKCCECKKGIALTARIKFVFGWCWTEDVEVTVRAGGGRSNLVNWYEGEPNFRLIVIHEVGHQFGLKDEYIDPRAPGRVIPPDADTSIMGAVGTRPAPEFKQRHFETIFLEEANKELPCSPYHIEPHTP